jgi:transposase
LPGEDCPAEYAPHTTVYNRFNRWSKKGIWAEILSRLAVYDATDLQCIDSTTAKAHRCARVEKGTETQTIGRNRGGRTTKIHAVADRAGRLIGFALTPGQRATSAPHKLCSQASQGLTYVLGDTAYDGDRLRRFLAERGSTAVIRPNPTRTNIPEFDAVLYKQRNLIERAFSHLKDWRRVATRYCKPAHNFTSTIALAVIIIRWARIEPTALRSAGRGRAVSADGRTCRLGVSSGSASRSRSLPAKPRIVVET